MAINIKVECVLKINYKNERRKMVVLCDKRMNIWILINLITWVTKE